jgi:autotransporter strand-loop-strand O-heptosyltransferase
MGRVLIQIGSRAMGDTVSCIPYIDKFRENTDDEVFVELNDGFIFLFEKTYPDLKFIGRDSNLIFDKILNIEYKYESAYKDSVQSSFAKQLGFIDPPYLRPRIEIEDLPRPIKGKYITIGMHSTSQMKYWNHPSGKRVQPDSPHWDELCRMIRREGIIPVVVEPYEMFGVPPYRNGMPRSSNKKYGGSLVESMNLVKHSEFYIGLSSGMSWVAHSMGKPVAMISNFTEDWNEFDTSLEDYKRISNKSGCHGCWNRVGKDFEFDKDDWYWCPEHKGTKRQFECHTSITPQMAFDEIKDWIYSIKG